MSVTLLSAWFQAVSSTGAPYSGALLYTYTSGTTTPVATYSDSTRTTPHANPVVADASGVFPTIYLSDSTTKLVLKTSTGTTIKTIDPVGELTTATTPLSIPTGAYFPYGGASAPTGYLLCDGTAYSRSTYSALFAVIGTSYGTGDGATTFNVPDLRGRTPFGRDNMGGSDAARIPSSITGRTSMGGTGGAGQVTLAETNLPSHSHSSVPTTAVVTRDGWTTTGSAPSPSASITSGRVVVGSGSNESAETLESIRAAGADLTVTLSGTASTSAIGSGTALVTLSPAQFGSYIIKT
jgi:microcystin-dependent protein